MPAKTPARKASPRRKPAPKKSTPAHKNGVKNGAKKGELIELQAAFEAALAEHEKTKNDLAAARYQTSSLEKALAEAKSSSSEIMARLTTHQAELEASRVESQNLREAVARASTPPPVRLGCPRCGKPMDDYQHDIVRAKRCTACHGIFFDNGEFDTMMKHHDTQILAGKKSWYSAFFGRK